tara:strand:- start:546 stop:1571 length:1026 start_codon:yes stop_codon:yes gene_type:complete
MNRQKANNISEDLLGEASLWHARITDDAASEFVWQSFTEWLEADNAHRLAYNEIEELSLELDILAEPVERLLGNKSSSPQGQSDTVIQAAWRWRYRNVWGGLAAAAAVIMLVIANIGLFNTPEVVTQEFSTVFGEQRLVKLDDGSVVHLNTNSKLEVSFEETARRTRLVYGEALFSVAKDRERPFFVSVGDRKVRVVGTKFNILRHGGKVTVTVAEGIVDVSPDAAGESVVSQPAARLTAGKQLVHIDGVMVSAISDVNADEILSWEAGVLAYDDAPLAFTIHELSRYFERPIKIEGDVSHITFSGILHVRDQDAVLQLLEETLPIKITRNDGVIIVTARK